MISKLLCLDVWTTKPGTTADGRRTGPQAHYLASNPIATRLDEWPVARELLLHSTVGQAAITWIPEPSLRKKGQGDCRGSRSWRGSKTSSALLYTTVQRLVVGQWGWADLPRWKSEQQAFLKLLATWHCRQAGLQLELRT